MDKSQDQDEIALMLSIDFKAHPRKIAAIIVNYVHR